MLTSFDEISHHTFPRDEKDKLREIDLKLAEGFRESLKGHLDALRVLHLELSHMYAVRLLATWEKQGFDMVLHLNMVNILSDRIQDELKTRFFLYVPNDKAELYLAPAVGWEEIISRFPTTQPDIEEMSRCLALSRYPAAVFHSVNVIEHGLIALGTFLRVRDPKSGWTAVSGELEKVVTKTKYTDLPPEFQKAFNFLEQTHGTVMALKGAWRNKISHAQGRLVILSLDFSPEICEEIIIASRSFMRRLATEMPSEL